MKPPPLKRKNKGLWITISLLALFLVISGIVNMGLFIGLAKGTGPAASMSQGHGQDEFPRLLERWSYGHGHTKAVRIAVRGMIVREPLGWLQPQQDKISDILSQIRAASHDPQVRAIIVELNSPGGAITPSDEIYMALMRFRESRDDRIVVVHMQDLAASGAYYIAAAGDWIMAEPTTVVGSIGVIMQALNWKQLADKIGVSSTTIKSGENKDLLNPFETVKEEQVLLLQELIDDMYERFLNLVAESRELDPTQLRELADGRVLTANEALEEQLIDEIGYWDDVVDQTAILLDEPSVKIVRYQSQVGFFQLLSSAQTLFSPQAWREISTPRLMYLWSP
jgi:protease-4